MNTTTILSSTNATTIIQLTTNSSYSNQSNSSNDCPEGFVGENCDIGIQIRNLNNLKIVKSKIIIKRMWIDFFSAKSKNSRRLRSK